MSSTSLLESSSSQLNVDIAVSGAGNSGSITNLTLEPQPGAARLATVYLSITPSGGSAIPVTVQFLFFDAAFEENNIFGAPKGTGPNSGQVGTVI